MTYDGDHVSYAYLPSVYPPGEVSVQIIWPFFTGLFVFLLLIFKSSLYILDTSPLSDKQFSNIFSKFMT